MAAASVDRVMCVAAGFIAAALCEIDKYWMDGWMDGEHGALVAEAGREREREREVVGSGDAGACHYVMQKISLLALTCPCSLHFVLLGARLFRSRGQAPSQLHCASTESISTKQLNIGRSVKAKFHGSRFLVTSW